MKTTNVILAAAIGLPLSMPALSQSSAGTAQITALEEIMVTARRRQETAQESPVPLTVLNDTLLDRYGVTGIDSIASMTPGLITGETGGAAGGSISLRGVGSGESQAFIDQAVSINIDGVPISTAQILRVAQMDLKQIEVLRGPQALFFGKNSPGGIISLVTASPGDEFEMMLRSGYEFEAEEWSVDGAISGPITDKMGFRLAAHYADMDGYFDVKSPTEVIPNTDPYGIEKSGLDAFPNREETFLRGTFLFDPTDRFRITLKGTYADTKVDGATSYFSDITHCPYDNPQELYPVASNCKNDEEIIAAKIPDVVLAMNSQLKPNGHRYSDQLLFSGTVEYELSDTLTLTSVTGYYDAEEEISSHGGYGLAPSNIYAVNYENEQFSEELRLASNYEGPVNFLVGAFYEDRELYTDTYIVIPTVGVCPNCFELPFEATGQDQETYSAFAQLMFDVNDQVQVSVGGRYTREDKEVNEYTIQTDAFATSPDSVLDQPAVDVLGLPTYTGKKKLEFNNFSPELTVTYKPTDDMMYFASYKEGYKSGGFDGSYTAGAILGTMAVNTFDPEEVSGFEAGLKSTLMDRQLTFNLTAYWYDYEDLQVAIYDTAARSFGTGNAAESQVRGIEIETKYRPQEIPGLELHASANFNDAKFEEYFAQCYKSQSQALGCDEGLDLNTGNPNTQDLSGEQLRKAPKVTATLGGYYETPISSDLIMSFSSDLSYSGKYNYGTDYQPYTKQSAFTKVDASIRLFSDDQKWELALIGRNLTDKRNLVNGIDRTGTGGAFGTTAPVCTDVPATGGCIPGSDVIGTPTRGRTLKLQATYRY